MSGGVKNIYVEDCTFLGTDVGLRFKSTRGRGGVVENIYINNINMINIPNEPLLFDLFYGGKGAGEESEEDLLSRMKTAIPPVTEETPAFRDIHISNVICRGSGRAMFFNGLPEMPIRNVTVKNVVMTEATDGVQSGRRCHTRKYLCRINQRKEYTECQKRQESESRWRDL